MPEAVGSPPQSASKSSVFLRRLISTLILWTVVISALFSSNRLLSDYVFLFIMLFLSGFGIWEFYSLVEKRNLVCFKFWGLLGGLLLMFGTFLNLTGHIGTQGSPARVNDFETSFLILFVLGLCLRQFVSRSNTAGILAIATTLFGLMYVPWLLNFIQKNHGIRFMSNGFGKLPAFIISDISGRCSDQPRYRVSFLVFRHIYPG